MKKNDKKSNQRLRSVILLLLVTGVVIGLVSSTAIKLASATYLMQKTKKPIIKVPQIIEEIINTVTPTPSTPSKPSTPAPQAPVTKAPTTKAPTTQAPTTQAPTTQAPVTQAPTTQAPTAPPVTVDPDAGIKKDQANFNSYKTVVEKAKMGEYKYTKTTNRTISMSFFQSLMVSGAEDIVINDVKYFNNPVTVNGVSNIDKDFIINNEKACLLDAADLQATSAAISSTEKEVLKDGSVKLTIVFNDESNPKPLRYEDTETEGFINAVVPVVSAEQVRCHADDQLGTDIETISLTYTGCSVELVYNPTTGEIISLNQVIRYNVEGKDGYKNVGATITETNSYIFE